MSESGLELLNSLATSTLLIAAKFNTTVADLADTNDIIKPADVTVGWVIRLPEGRS